jgi:hypothetical protein
MYFRSRVSKEQPQGATTNCHHTRNCHHEEDFSPTRDLLFSGPGIEFQAGKQQIPRFARDDNS